MENSKYKVEDPWHEAFANFELGILSIRKKEYLGAKIYLVQALKAPKNFFFFDQLQTQVNQALLFLKDMKLVKMEEKKKQDVIGMYVQSETVDMSSSETAVVPAGYAFEKKITMKTGTTVSWRWGVEMGKVGFKVSFKTAEETEIVEAYEAEMGDSNEGFFTSKTEGTLLLHWDNTKNVNTDRNIFYTIN